jgi:Rps23 Pro-64 3,4-dihydroxylase Tpa1-like proline 4-hydroxylase
MINFEELEKQVGQAQEQWKKDSPFPYCIFDNLLETQVAQEIYDGFPETIGRTGKDPYAAKRHKDVNRKLGTSNPDIMTAIQKQFFEDIMDKPFLSFLERVTGISPLYPDENLSGGGLHEIYEGGFLNLHADFNFHPHNNKLRRLNMIVYLNPEWEEAWHGYLELWPEKMDSDPVKIPPLFNKAAIFETTETSWHGHPDPIAPPPGTTRRSLAVYYYSDWPEGLVKRSKTLYVLSPSQRANLIKLLSDNLSSIENEQEAIALASEFQPRHVKIEYRILRKQQK